MTTQAARRHTHAHMVVQEEMAAQTRALILTRMWKELRESIPALNVLPERVVITCGWTSRAARGPIQRRLPADVVTGEWQNDPEGEAFVSIHPERFHTIEEVAMAMVYAMGRAALGKRWGHEKAGVHKDTENGKLSYTVDNVGAHARMSVANVIDRVGELPAGFAIVPPPKKIARSRMRKFVCERCGFIIRAAADVMNMTHERHGKMVRAEEAGKQAQVAA